MVDRVLAVVGDEVLLAYVGDVIGLLVFGEQMIEGLVFGRPQRLRDRLVPFLSVREDGIDVEDYAAEIEDLVAHDLADGEAGARNIDLRGHGKGTFERFKRGHALLSR